MKYSVEDIVRKIGKWFSKERRIIFFITFILGMLMHFPLYTNRLLTVDGYWHYGAFLAKGWEISLGRFGLPFVDLFRGTVVSSVLSSILACVILAFTSIFLCETLQIKKTHLKILTSILLVVIPTFSTTLMYSYTADSYMFSFFFSVLAVYFLKKQLNLKNVLLSIMSVCISLSLYQAYFAISVTLPLFCFILKLWENHDLKESMRALLKSGLALFAGAILYFILLKVVLLLLHLNLNAYKGANSILSVDLLKQLPSSLQTMYVTFFDFYFGDTIVHNNGFFYRNFLNIGLSLLFLLQLIGLIRQNKLYQNIPHLFVLLISIFMIPIATCIVEWITGTKEMSLLMTMPFLLPYILLLKQTDSLKKGRWNQTTSFLSVLGILFLGWTYTLGNFATYEASNMYQNQMYARGIEIREELANHQEYDGKQVAIVGHLSFSSDNQDLSKMTNFDVSKSGSYVTYASYYRNNLTFDYTMIKKEETYLKLAKEEEFYQMPIFPEPGSIRLIDDVVVVRVGH